MTDTPDYSRLNPRVLLGHKAVAQVKTNPEKIVAPTLRVYNADGTPHIYEAPTHEETGALLDTIIELMDGKDLRHVIRMVQEVDEALQAALFQTLSAAHMVAHNIDYNAGYDEDTLCDGVHAYLDPERASAPHGHDEAPDAADMLQKFFVKPDQKPN